MLRQVAHARKRLLRGARRLVRMNTNRGVQEWTAIGEFRGVDHHHGLDARGQRAIQNRLAVLIEFRIVDVAMRIDQRHFNRAPTGMSSWKPASTGLPPSTLAATIIPLDSMPFSLRGCRLATMTTLRFNICSGV